MGIILNSYENKTKSSRADGLIWQTVSIFRTKSLVHRLFSIYACARLLSWRYSIDKSSLVSRSFETGFYDVNRVGDILVFFNCYRRKSINTLTYDVTTYIKIPISVMSRFASWWSSTTGTVTDIYRLTLRPFPVPTTWLANMIASRKSWKSVK